MHTMLYSTVAVIKIRLKCEYDWRFKNKMGLPALAPIRECALDTD